MRNRLASAGLLGLRERPVQVARTATLAGSSHNANYRMKHSPPSAKLVAGRAFQGDMVRRLRRTAVTVK